ncbi:glycosyltransferase family 25 protein [Methylobacterium sp. J-072]|uniref:glycosyltransferase family 25 protein n=1 Tax=Methylobacterium sp. J-072 TaxID=2836651 RepID=UPI001FBB92C9|nr:glycosyltransferase family 25 protein [Methylobacterium sp. J-072]MCJ2094675.1 glycosyltransferase family 25 protein [Methylobacterium sp. J-072]
MCCIAISVPRFRERHAYITRHLHTIWGPDFEVLGIDGTVAGRDAAPDSGLSPGQVGCALSHLAAYESMIARKLPWGLIVADDAVLPPDIHDILVRVEATLRRGDVVLLHNRPQHRAAFSTVDAVSIGDYRLCLPMSMGGLGANAAYVITRQAAEGILAANRPVVAAANDWGFFYQRQAISRARVMSPNPVALKAFETPIFSSGSKGGRGLMAGSRLLQPLWVASRKFMSARITGKTTFVDEASPYGTMSPQ